VLAMKPVHHPEPPPSPPPAAKFQNAVGAVGLVEANTENINVSCAVSGMVTQLYVRAGDHVQKGQKLFSLDDRELEADLAVKRTALNNARAQLAKLIAEPRPEELPPLEAKVTEAQALVAERRGASRTHRKRNRQPCRQEGGCASSPPKLGSREGASCAS